jgi:hypothetical protein
VFANATAVSITLKWGRFSAFGGSAEGREFYRFRFAASYDFRKVSHSYMTAYGSLKFQGNQKITSSRRTFSLRAYRIPQTLCKQNPWLNGQVLHASHFQCGHSHLLIFFLYPALISKPGRV